MVGAVTLLRESWHFTLRFIREMGIFMHNATPFFQTILGFFEKLVGGFYLLIAMVYRDVRNPRPNPNNVPYSSISNPNINANPRMIKYVPPSAWGYRKESPPPADSWFRFKVDKLNKEIELDW